MTMKFSFREIQSVIYLVVLLVSIAFMIISFNDLVTKNSSLINSGVTLQGTGNWDLWIITLSFIGTGVFAYFFFKLTSDVKKFRRIVGGSSKQIFLKNIKELELLARKLGPSFEQSLAAAKTRWNIK